MVISIDSLLIKQLRKLLNVILAISLFTWQDVWRDNSILESMSSSDRYHNKTQETKIFFSHRNIAEGYKNEETT